MVAAAIRFKNPGAMWGKGNPIATKWGATSTVALNDGLGQGNNIADFPDFIHGAAAQFDLWRTGYTNRTLRAAITRWSGGNWSQPYADSLVKKTGIGLEQQVTVALLAGPQGLELMKAQAFWEAGTTYPMSDADWATAQRLVFATAPKVAGPAKSKAGTVAGGAAGTVVVAAQAAQGGTPWWAIALFVLAGIGITGLVFWLIHSKHSGVPVVAGVPTSVPAVPPAPLPPTKAV